MFIRFLLLAISLTLVIFCIDVLFPIVKRKYRIHKEIKKTRQSRKAFMKKMKELEIK